MNVDQKAVGYAILRTTLGFVFIFYGLEKSRSGASQFANVLQKDFSGTWLPPAFIHAFGLTLPFFELGIGLLLFLGLFTKLALILAGLLLAVLTAGLAVLGNSGGVAHNLIFSMIVFWLLVHAEQNELSLDRLRSK